MANRKFDGRVVITRKSVKGENSQAARVARFDMQKEGTKLLSEDQVFTQEELDELYAHDKNEPWWNR
jgi:hypothetical protein